MPEDLTLLDELEHWIECQIPRNLGDLPRQLFDTVERVTQEIFDTLNIHGPPSLSLPFPPFTLNEPPPPAPPLPPPSTLSTYGLERVEKLARAHPYACAGGAALVLTVGLGAGYGAYKRGGMMIGGRAGVRGVVNDGMLKDAIVILSPSPMPPLLLPLAVSLLRSGYIVLIAVPHVDDAEQLERKLSGLEEKNALRVLIYDPDDSSTFPPFHRSLNATLTLRFPSIHTKGTSDPYNPRPDHIPHIYTYISLYPLNPSPPSQPSPLPALPTLLAPTSSDAPARLITIYPSASTLVQPDSFATQLLAANHHLLSRNLGAFSHARSVSVYIGDIHLPLLPTLIIGGGAQVSRRQQAKAALKEATTAKKASIVKDYIMGYFSSLYTRLAAYTGLGTAGREYELFESSFLRLVRADRSWRTRYHLGQYSYLTLFLSRLPTFLLPRLLPLLPVLPTATGPTTGSGYDVPPTRGGTQPRGPRPRTPLPTVAKGNLTATSTSSSDEAEADLASSFHTTGTSSSRGQADAGSDSSARSRSSEGRGLGDSWVGVEDGGN
ncbi:uncharacterized protein MKK02DRAFT_39770 [Dioszegia hungarica]|uniref:DUF1776-domain-containing protein n=1 Tax=Dioszegia hungarica TaxID=4972 RepID=A0AA38HFM9_9TREE|nr:uncharacterized protein MKK02DRAFT_39770 [Dioszegia hungarica]KAI9639471.1 hypothetical protein MKK02DRAFT_39770 [Dioszegia hungarica]